MANDADFLGQFPPGSLERQYHGTLLVLINEIDFPRSEAVELARLRFLQVADFTVGQVDTIIAFQKQVQRIVLRREGLIVRPTWQNSRLKMLL